MRPDRPRASRRRGPRRAAASDGHPAHGPLPPARRLAVPSRGLGAEVWLPEDASAADEEPDHTYADGDLLPGGLRAFRTPGPEWPHYSFLYEGDPGVVFCSDLLTNADAVLRFIPPSLHDDPAATRASVEHLLGLPFGILCFAHGEPILDDPKAALREVLKQGD